MDASHNTAAGTFDGQPFKLVSGLAQDDKFDAGKFKVLFFNETLRGDVCKLMMFDYPDQSILFVLPKVVGKYPLSPTQSVTFNLASVENNKAIAVANGEVELISITDTLLTGRILAHNADKSCFFEGSFAVPICKS
jgi:hypothetical protein